MSSRRVLKAAECIRQVVSMSILVELKDPRIENVTVTFVEVSSDMRNAKIHVSVMGDEAKQKLCLKGLQNSAGFLQQKINERMDTRYVPKIRFVLDQGVKNSIAVTRILEEVLPEESDNEESDSKESNTVDSNTEDSSQVVSGPDSDAESGQFIEENDNSSEESQNTN